MAKKNFDFNKSLKKILIVYAAFFLVGIIIAVIFGVKMDTNFKGGTLMSYSYEAETLDVETVKSTVSELTDVSFNVSESTSIAGDTKTVTITFVGNNALDAEVQENITAKLNEALPDAGLELYNSSSVSPTMALTFFVKCLAAVLLTGILVVVYVGLRFKNIGGVKAAVTAFVALFMDMFVTFFICVIFRLQIDTNYIAVVLTILGYSLNDTIVVYDRVRENRKLNRSMPLDELVNLSCNGVMTRNIITSVTTILAVLTIVVVSEVCGLTSLRSFAIPMSFGLLSGCVTSLAVAAPLWVLWKKKEKKN